MLGVYARRDVDTLPRPFACLACMADTMLLSAVILHLREFGVKVNFSLWQRSSQDFDQGGAEV